jgi:hypothetical protein
MGSSKVNMQQEPEITAKLRAFDCHCQQCGHQFVGLDFSDFDYGRRIFRTKGGRYLALWVSHEDPVADEFDSLLQKLVKMRLRPRERADLFDLTFGITCDPINGEFVDSSQRQVCPKCNSNHLRTFSIIPKRLVETKVYPVRHTQWLKKRIQDKERELLKIIGPVIRKAQSPR